MYILYWTNSELGASPIWLANQEQLSNTKQGLPAIINFSLDVIGQMGQLSSVALIRDSMDVAPIIEPKSLKMLNDSYVSQKV